MDIQEFVRKYGVKSTGLLVERLISYVPETSATLPLVKVVNEMMSDLESALERSGSPSSGTHRFQGR